MAISQAKRILSLFQKCTHAFGFVCGGKGQPEQARLQLQGAVEIHVQSGVDRMLGHSYGKRGIFDHAVCHGGAIREQFALRHDVVDDAHKIAKENRKRLDEVETADM